jgi:hypothetical protein
VWRTSPAASLAKTLLPGGCVIYLTSFGGAGVYEGAHDIQPAPSCRSMAHVRGETIMLNRKLPSIAAFAATIAAGLWIPATAALSGLPLLAENPARYLPIQSISYEFGSKSMSGYFVAQAGTCFVTLMIIEKGDPEELLPLSPARVRLVLYPGQIAGLDSEDGRSLNFTCGDNAASLLVDAGERDRLVKLQASMFPKDVARSP